MIGATIFSGALAFFLLGCAIAAFITEPTRHDKTTRPRGKPLDDPGGYRAYGDWPLVPSDLKALHDGRETNR